MKNKKNNQMIFNITPETETDFLKVLLFFNCCSFILLCIDTSKKEKDDQIDTVVTESVAETPRSKKTILFFGDSLTAGYGLEDINDAFPGLIQTKIDSLRFELYRY